VITVRPKWVRAVVPAKAKLESVWFDDTTSTPRLRDANTGNEYELDPSALVNYAKPEPLATSAKTARSGHQQAVHGVPP
jgi:hypothetical protein